MGEYPVGAEAQLQESLASSDLCYVLHCVHPSYNHIKLQINLFLIKLGQ